MAYSTSNPPQKVSQGIGDGGVTFWAYVTADAPATVAAADYFTNAEDLGMKVNDVLMLVTTGAGVTLHRVSTIDPDGNGTVAAATLA